MKTLKYHIPDKLEKVFKSDNYLHDGGMVISSLEYLEDDLTVTFNLYPDLDRKLKQIWELRIKNIASEKFIRNWTEHFTFYSDHFLLYEFNDPSAELYYNGKAAAPEKLFIDLYQSLLKTYHQDFPFWYGINGAMDIFKLCKEGSGLFARGPKRILEKYQLCLAEHNIKSNFVGVLAKSEPKLKLLVFGESYFIGEEFLFTQL